MSDFVQENVVEKPEVKQTVIAAIDAVLPPDRVIASSTSSIVPSDLQARCRHPERVVVGHPFNPPHLIPLVEVVGGKQTNAGAVDWSVAFYDSVGKKAIRLNREIPGHYVNRVQEAMWREVVHCVAEGIVSVEAAEDTREAVIAKLLKLGYPESGTAEGIAAAKARAKSFVSCAVGRLSSED